MSQIRNLFMSASLVAALFAALNSNSGVIGRGRGAGSPGGGGGGAGGAGGPGTGGAIANSTTCGSGGQIWESEFNTWRASQGLPILAIYGRAWGLAGRRCAENSAVGIPRVLDNLNRTPYQQLAADGIIASGFNQGGAEIPTGGCFGANNTIDLIMAMDANPTTRAIIRSRLWTHVANWQVYNATRQQNFGIWFFLRNPVP